MNLPVDTKPDFVIIGAMKCATSTLHDQLGAQSGFFMSDPKEPNFFSDDSRFEQGADWYRGLFRDAPAGSIRGESSTHYTKLPTYLQTIDRLAALIPDAKFVYLMRHPIDRLVSHYIHEWTEANVSDSIDEATDNCPELIEYGRYAMQLEPWLARFGSNAVMPVFLERLKADPQHTLERVCRFLGYDGEVCWDADHGRSNASQARLRKSRLRDLVVNAPGLRELRRMLVPQALRDRIKSRWQMARCPELSDDARERLAHVFDRDLAQLGDWLGVELSCETFNSAVAQQDLEWSPSAEAISP